MEQQLQSKLASAKVDTVYSGAFTQTHPSSFAEYIQELIQNRLNEGYTFNQFIPAINAEHKTQQCYGFLIFTSVEECIPEEDAYEFRPVTQPRRD